MRSMQLFSFYSAIFLAACGGSNSSSHTSSNTALSSKASSVQAESSSSRSSTMPSSSRAQSSENFQYSAVRVSATGSYLGANAAPVFALLLGAEPEDQSCRDPNLIRLTEVYDNTLNKFVFSFRVDVEDIDCATEKPDRQRLEVKTSNTEPTLTGKEGDEYFYSWQVLLPEDLSISTSFSHIFQLKPLGGDDAMPLISLTVRKANPNRLELLYAQTSDAQRIAEFPLSQLLGRWLNIRIHANFSNRGSLELTINDSQNDTQLFKFQTNDIDLWREGIDHNRAKWGLYRSLVNKQDLKSETLLFSDFCIAKTANNCW